MHNRSVFIGSSMFGIEALKKLVSGLPADFPAPIFIAQHVSADSPGLLPGILSRAGALRARLARRVNAASGTAQDSQHDALLRARIELLDREADQIAGWLRSSQ